MGVPTNIIIDELRARNEKKLDAAAARVPGWEKPYSPLLSLASLPKISALKEVRKESTLKKLGEPFQRILGERAQIEKLASTQSQREAFGTDQWHERFIRLRDLRGTREFQDNTNSKLAQIWAELPHSRFTRFQEIFCDPDNFIYFRTGAHSERTITPSRDMLNTYSLKGCLVSPDRIPNKLLHDLGLIEWGESRVYPLEALVKKSSLSIIQSLKLVWESTARLTPSNHRILVVQNAATDLTAHYPEAKPLANTLRGTILYTREDDSTVALSNSRQQQKWPPRKLIVQHYASAYAALRKTDHEHTTYRTELSVLSDVKTKWSILNRQLNTNWKKTTPVEEKVEMLDEVRKLCQASLPHFKDAKNPFKQKIAILLREITGQVSDGSRRNPSATMSKMVALITDAERRLQDIAPKKGFNDRDASLLEQHIVQHETAFKLLSRTIQSDYERVCSVRTTPEREQRMIRLLRKVADDTHTLKDIRLRPFISFAEKIQEQQKNIKSALERGDISQAQDGLVKLFVVIKFHAVNAVFENIRKRTIAAEDLPLTELKRSVDALKTIFSTYQVLPTQSVPGYVKPYETVRKQVEGLLKGLQHYEKRNLDLESRAQMYKRLRDYLANTDIESLVTKLA